MGLMERRPQTVGKGFDIESMIYIPSNQNARQILG